MWFKVDDGLAFHRKVLKAGNEAIGAWARAGAWSSAPSNLTEGYIPPEVASQIAPARVWAKLRAAGLTEAPSEGREGEQIHDFTVYNPTAAKVRAERDGWSDRQRKARESRRDKRVSHGHVSGVPFPIPVHGDPEGGSGSPPAPADDLLRFLADAAADGHPWCTKIQAELLSQGGRLTPPQKVALKKIRVELGALTASAPMPADAPAPPRRNVAPPAPAPVAGPVPILFHAPISSSEGAE
jgi:hypothetical protein